MDSQDENDIIDILNIKVDSNVEQDDYMLLLIMFYLSIYHHLYIALKNERQKQDMDKADDIMEFEISQQDLDKAIKSIERDEIYTKLLKKYQIQSEPYGAQLVMAKLEYLFHYKQPVSNEVTNSAETILRANAVMTEFIKLQFQEHADPPCLKKLSVDPLTSKDEAASIPDAFYLILNAAYNQLDYEEFNKVHGDNMEASWFRIEIASSVTKIIFQDYYDKFDDKVREGEEFKALKAEIDELFYGEGKGPNSFNDGANPIVKHFSKSRFDSLQELY